MSKNVFDKIQDVTTNVSKNTFDWSHANNFTAQIGKIVPIFCEQMPAGSSIKINPTFALKFMPMMFPIQTRMKAYLSFFRVPLRALWTDYADFISSPNSDSTLVAPYLGTTLSGIYKKALFDKGHLMGVGGLSDYLGVPVTYTLPPASNVSVVTQDDPKTKAFNTAPADIKVGGNVTIQDTYTLGNSVTTALLVFSNNGSATTNELELARVTMVLNFNSNNFEVIYPSIKENAQSFACVSTGNIVGSTTQVFARSSLRLDDEHLQVIELADGRKQVTMVWEVPVLKYGRVYFTCPASTVFVNTSDLTLKGTQTGVQLFTVVPINSAPMGEDQCPYYGFCDSSNNAKAIQLSAYPYRAYEAIYNGYMRNIRNNPFILDGKPTYNRYITNNKGGQDNVEYDLFNANWASDAFTTAVPSPQRFDGKNNP